MKTMTKWVVLVATLASATMISAASPKLTCTFTGKEVPKCCCVPQKDGKQVCTLTKKVILDKCCCQGM